MQKLTFMAVAAASIVITGTQTASAAPLGDTTQTIQLFMSNKD